MFGRDLLVGQLWNEGDIMAFTLEDLIRQGGAAGATGGFSIPTQLAFQGGGAGLDFIGNLLAGDGGRGKRIDAASATATNLLDSKFDQSVIDKQRTSFERGTLSPLIRRLTKRAAGRSGLDSGVSQGFIASKTHEAGARFETDAIQNELGRILQKILAGANIQRGLARV